MRGTESVVHIHIAQRRHFFRELVAVFFLAAVKARVFEQHRLARHHADAVNPIAYQRDFKPQNIPKPARNRRQRKFRCELAFFGPPEMRRDHHRGPSAQCRTNCRRRSADARVFGDVASVVLRNIQVGADKYAASSELPVCNQTIKSIDVH